MTDLYCPIYYRDLVNGVVGGAKAEADYLAWTGVKNPRQALKLKMRAYEKWINGMEPNNPVPLQAPTANTTEVSGITENRVITDIDVAKKYAQLYDSAKRRGKEFTLTLGEVKQLLKRKKCFYTGIEFVYEHSHPHHRTIDRIDNKKGYIKGNVVACCHAVNQLKEELLESNEAFFKDDIKMLFKFIKTLKEVM
jgi:hypothetical protein